MSDIEVVEKKDVKVSVGFFTAVMFVAWTIAGLCMFIMLVSSVVRGKTEQRDSSNGNELKALCNETAALRKEVTDLKKFKEDSDIVIPRIVQLTDGIVGSQDRLLREIRPVLIQQAFDTSIIARSMGNHFGRDKWTAMVVKAQADIDAEIKASQSVSSSTNKAEKSK